MPKFYRQNKKRIDPRYFLSETTNRDEDLGEAITSKFNGEMDAMKRIQPGKEMLSDPDYRDGYTGDSDQTIENIESLLQSMLSSGAAYGMEVEFADVLDASMDNDPKKSLNDEQKGILIYAYLDSDPARRGKPKANRKELHRAMKAAVETVYSGLPKGGKTDSDNDGIPDEKEFAVIDNDDI